MMMVDARRENDSTQANALRRSTDYQHCRVASRLGRLPESNDKEILSKQQKELTSHRSQCPGCPKPRTCCRPLSRGPAAASSSWCCRREASPFLLLLLLLHGKKNTSMNKSRGQQAKTDRAGKGVGLRCGAMSAGVRVHVTWGSEYVLRVRVLW